MPNWKKVIISGSDASLPNIYLDDYIYHNESSLDTFFGFAGSDLIQFGVGGINRGLQGPGYTAFNISGLDVDFQVYTSNDDNALYIVGSSDNVGIGTSTPSTKFHVYNGEATIASSTDGVKLSYSNGNSSGIIDTAFADNNLEFRTNGSTRMFITGSSGNVGIGTTGPEAKLTIKSDPGDTNQPTRITNSSTDAHTGLFLNGTGGTTGEKYGMQFGGYNEYSIGGIFGVLDSAGGSTSGDITIDFADGTSAGALIEKVRFTHEGNVGIGTLTPQEKLTVEGNISASGDLLLSQSIFSYQTNTDIDTGTETVATIDGSAYKAAFFDYVAVSASVNIRAGSIMVAHDGTNTTQAEASTQDLGNTAGIKFSSSIDGSNNFRLSAAVASDNWSVKTVVRGI